MYHFEEFLTILTVAEDIVEIVWAYDFFKTSIRILN